MIRAMLTIIVRYEVEKGKGAEVAAILARHAAQSTAEPGCAQFVAHQFEDDPDVFVLYEQYVDEAALEAHRQTPHFRENIQERVMPLLTVRQAGRYHILQATAD
jgi:(4S)-4-hydroxy-5-phosphonooxypentane-2,3-dione isomerase